MSDRQIERSVLDGKKITATLASGHEVVGYVCGKDDYHWMLVALNAESTMLVHKSAPLIHINGRSTLDEEPAVEDLKKIIDPYRKAVQRAFNGSSTEKD